jgi:peroxiredoxin
MIYSGRTKAELSPTLSEFVPGMSSHPQFLSENLTWDQALKIDFLSDSGVGICEFLGSFYPNRNFGRTGI